MAHEVHLVPLKNGTYTFRIDGAQNLTHDEAVKLISSPDILQDPANRAVLDSLVPASEWLRGQQRRLRKRFPWMDLLLEFGQDFSPVDQVFFDKERAGHCFVASFQDVHRMREKQLPIEYVEGVGIFAYRVIHHGWTCHGTKAFDFAWPAPLLSRYFGIAFDIDWMDEVFGILKGQGRVSVFRHWNTHQREIEQYLTSRQ